MTVEPSLSVATSSTPAGGWGGTVVIDDFSAGTWAIVADGVEVIEGDITRPEAADPIAALRPHMIVHAAALVSVPRSMADRNSIAVSI